MEKSPYKFLDSYSREDHNIFFGRDHETDELYSRVFESRIVIVYGTSGTGKSSLINCGLANKFNDADWLPIMVRRGSNINQSLYDALGRAVISHEAVSYKKSEAPATNAMLKMVRSIYLDHFKPLYLIFDQFEELFIFGGTGEKNEFISEIKKIVDSDLQCRLIFSIREEYLAGFTEFERVIPSFLSNRIRIEKMTRQNAISVIEGPCRVSKIDIERGFPEALLDKLNPDSPDVELTYLQVYLDKIFHLGSQGGQDINKLDRDLLERAGDVKDLLGEFIEEQVSQLDDPELGMLVLKSFVSVKGTRQQVNEEEVLDYSRSFGKASDSDSVKNLIQKFIHLRILRDKDENGRYELRHDHLASKIFEKITLVEKDLLEIRNFLTNAFENFLKRKLYLSADDLKYIYPYEDKIFLNDKITEFISDSRSELLKVKRRRQNILATVALSIIFVLTAFTIWALNERGNAIDQRVIADLQKDAAIKAGEEAEAARQEALLSKNLALEKEQLALKAQGQSEEAEREAMIQRENALRQKGIAEKLAVQAGEQAEIANEERQKAEEERAKAIVAGGKSRQLSLLATAQNLALRSSGIENNPELTGLLAVQAFNFNKDNNGRTEDPVIYEALNNAYSLLDKSRHSLITGSQNEIWALGENREDMLMSADIEGNIRTWGEKGEIISTARLPLVAAANYIYSDRSFRKIITQLDNSELLLWNLGSSDISDVSPKELKGHIGFIRAAVFSPDDRLLATAGRDSTVIVWQLSGEVIQTALFKYSSGIRAIAFSSPDTLYAATEDGSIIQWDTRKDRPILFFTSEKNRLLSLAWNDRYKILAAGCTDGSLLVFRHNIAAPVKYTLHSAGIDIVVFSNDFSLMATSGWDRTIKFYNYDEYFGHGNIVGNVGHIRNLNARVRSLSFAAGDKLVAGLADKSIRVWETSSEKLASLICNMVIRDMTQAEWDEIVGKDIPYEKTCNRNP